ncbi:MAG: hypothetical protein K6D97_00250 [Clostridia bacterium]|nr:hypothetical protein [Clostridia bacterium]
MINYREINKDLIKKHFYITLDILGKYCRHDELEEIGFDDLYYRSQIFKHYEKKIDYNQAEENVHKYNKLLYELEKLKDDESRAKFVASIEDKEMKLSLLSYIQKRENRDLIVKSFDRKVDKEVEDLDSLIQRMIREYFEDKLGNKLTDEKRERLELVLRGSDVSYGDVSNKIKGRDLIGFADNIERSITISSEVKEKIKKALGILAHEYGHLFSMFNVVFTNVQPEFECEEGMADIFEDVVINHFLQKYGRIELNGMIIIEDYPYIGPSCYNSRGNLFPRTMLAGLESSGKDAEAISEYFLGNKKDFLKLIFGERALVPGFEKYDFYNYTVISNNADRIVYDENQERLYHSPFLDYSRISRDSIYYHRENTILPLFIIQNKVNGKAEVFWGFNNKLGFNNDIGNVAEIFFDGKSFFEVKNEEFQEFLALLKDASIHYDDSSSLLSDYMDACTCSLHNAAVQEHSFEIMEKLALIVEMIPETPFKTEWKNVLNLATHGEIEKLQNVQMTEEQIFERQKLFKKYISFFSKEKKEDIDVIELLRELELKCEEKKKEIENDKPALVNRNIIDVFAQEEGVPLKKDAAINATKSLVLTERQNNDMDTEAERRSSD